MPAEELVVHGAREHNLKDITVRLPRNRLICITGLSGSGKSSLAFDTIYAEGQRRYVESLSAYARQFLQMMEKPDVDHIDGLSPAISIDQKTTSRNPRSTVGTVTEIYDYLRLLYARVGRPHCPICGKPIAGQSLDAIVDQVLKLDEGTRFTVNAPVVRDRKGEYKDVFEDLTREGFTRVKVDGEQYVLEEGVPELDKKFKHTIEVIVDRLLRSGDPGDRRPLRDRHLEAVGRVDGGRADPLPARDGRREDLRPVPQPHGAEAPVHARVRRHRRQSPAPLPRDGLFLPARADRGVHVAAALPGLQGRAPEAGGAGGHGRRPVDPRVHADVR